MTPQQNYANHRRIDPMYHFGLTLITLAVLIGSIIHLIRAVAGGEDVWPAVLLVLIGVLASFYFLYIRGNALKAQDRAIRAEENLRHYILTGKRLDPRLTIHQIVALRFAGDDEFPALAAQAAEERIRTDDIKKAIREWRPDWHRV